MSFNYSDSEKKALLKKFDETRTYLSNFAHIEGFDEAVEWFDNTMQTCPEFKFFTQDLTKLRKKFFSDEKDIVALVYAMEETGIKQTIDNYIADEYSTESDEEEAVDDIAQVKNILEDEFHKYTGNPVFVESSHTDTKAMTGEDNYITLSALLDFDIPREKKYSFCNDEVQKIYNKFFMDYRLFDKDINVEEYADFIEECDPIIFTVMLNCNNATMSAGVDLGNKLGSVVVKGVQLDETIDEKGLRKAVQDMIKCF